MRICLLALALTACGSDGVPPADAPPERCDDDDPRVHPDNPEIRADGIDNDCDGFIDCEDADIQDGVWEGELD